jgi:lipoprotein NlpD
MKSISHVIVVALLAAVLQGCASSTAKAPIDSRNNQKTTTSKAQTSSQKNVPAADYSGYHVVQAGDTLYSIAWRYGLNYRELASMNGIRSPYTIYKGQRLRVRPGSQQQAATPVALQQPAPVKAAPAAAASASKPPSRPAAKPATAPPPKATTTAARTTTQKTAPATRGTKGPAYDGNWVWPTRGRVLTPFQPSGTGKRGIDIGGHEDQPIKAAANGKVVYAGSGLVGYGRLIIVKHNENLLSAYGHNNKLLVEEGEHVTAGQMIAKMGSSGTNRNELYFEIRKNGKPTDPLRYLPKQ